MNAKEVKRLRKRARTFINLYVIEYVLTEEHVLEAYENGYTYETLYQLIPHEMMLRDGFTVKQGMGTVKWWNKRVKNSPNATYESLVEELQHA
jgi:hypothetical protein